MSRQMQGCSKNLLLSPLCLRLSPGSNQWRGKSLVSFTVQSFSVLDTNLPTLALQQTCTNQPAKQAEDIRKCFKRPHSSPGRSLSFSPGKEEAFYPRALSVRAGMDPDATTALQDAHTKANKVLMKPFLLVASCDQQVFYWCFSPNNTLLIELFKQTYLFKAQSLLFSF